MKLSKKEILQRLIDSEGRTQEWIIMTLNKKGNELTSTKFSLKKQGKMEFTKKEMNDIGEIFNYPLQEKFDEIDGCG